MFALSQKTATKSATLPKKQLGLLLHIYRHQDRNSRPEIYLALNWPGYKVTRIANILVKKGLLQKVQGYPVFYELTQAGKNCCTSAMVGNKDYIKEGIVHRLHGPLTFISKIIRKPQALDKKLLENSFVPYEPVGGTCYKKKLYQVGIIFTPSTARFYMPDIYGDQHEVYNEALNHLYDIIGHLEGRFPGLRLGEPECVARISHQHIAAMGDPLALEYRRTSEAIGKTILYRSERMHVESKGSKGVPETEYIHKAHAQEDLHHITQQYEHMIRGKIDLKDFHESLGEIKALQQGGLQTVNAMANTQTILAAVVKTQSKILGRMVRDIRKIKHGIEQRTLKEFVS